MPVRFGHVAQESEPGHLPAALGSTHGGDNVLKTGGLTWPLTLIISKKAINKY